MNQYTAFYAKDMQVSPAPRNFAAVSFTVVAESEGREPDRISCRFMIPEGECKPVVDDEIAAARMLQAIAGKLFAEEATIMEHLEVERDFVFAAVSIAFSVQGEGPEPDEISGRFLIPKKEFSALRDDGMQDPARRRALADEVIARVNVIAGALNSELRV